MLTGSLLKNSSAVSFRGAEGDEESRIPFNFRARFLAPLGMTRSHKVFQPTAQCLACPWEDPPAGSFFHDVDENTESYGRNDISPVALNSLPYQQLR